MIAAPVDVAMEPHDMDAEQALLGALLLDRDAIVAVANTISASDFYSEANADIYTAIRALMRKRVPADLITVKDELDRYGRFDAIGGLAYLTELLLATPTSMHAEYHAGIVVRLASKRRLIKAAAEIVRDAYATDIDPEEAVNLARIKLANVTPEAQRGEILTFAELADDLAREIESRRNPEYQVDVVRTGLADIDRHLRGGGFERNQKIVVAGRPGSGKTSFALQVAKNFARLEALNPEPQWTVIFSAEMSARGLMWRSLSEGTAFGQADLNGGLSTHELQMPARLTPAQNALIDRELLALAELPILIDDRPSPTTDQIRDTVERLQAKYPVRFVLFDYIGLAGNPEKKGGTTQDRIAGISAGLMTMTKACDVSTMILSQLNRGVEAREDKRPRLSDLRDSGAIEQDADIVLGVYNHDNYVRQGSAADDARLHNITEIGFLKHRDGQTPIVQVRFNAKTTSFTSLDRSYV